MKQLIFLLMVTGLLACNPHEVPETSPQNICISVYRDVTVSTPVDSMMEKALKRDCSQRLEALMPEVGRVIIRTGLIYENTLSVSNENTVAINLEAPDLKDMDENRKKMQQEDKASENSDIYQLSCRKSVKALFTSEVTAKKTAALEIIAALKRTAEQYHGDHHTVIIYSDMLETKLRDFERHPPVSFSQVAEYIKRDTGMLNKQFGLKAGCLKDIQKMIIIPPAGLQSRSQNEGYRFLPEYYTQLFKYYGVGEIKYETVHE